MIASLTSHERERYAQQIKLSNIGLEGQTKLKGAKVLCIGAGGLGTPLLSYLVAAGVGTLGIVDDDVVELSNLHRQILYHDHHVGTRKVESMRQQLLSMNPNLNIEIYSSRFNLINAADLIQSYDIVADCSDNFSTRYLINASCFRIGKPYVFASISQFQGKCSTFLGRQGPCFQCLFPKPPEDDAIQNCEESGVLGVLPGLLGVIQATEIMKWILQQGDLLVGRVLVVDILPMQFREFQLQQHPDCDLCVHYRMMGLFKNRDAFLRSSINMNEYTISVRELDQALKNNEEIQLIDVRTAEKHQAFNIGGKLIPLDELNGRLNELDPNKKIVTYCTSGGRSMRALQILLEAGFTSVKSLDGGMTAWREECK